MYIIFQLNHYKLNGSVSVSRMRRYSAVSLTHRVFGITENAGQVCARSSQPSKRTLAALWLNSWWQSARPWRTLSHRQLVELWQVQRNVGINWCFVTVKRRLIFQPLAQENFEGRSKPRKYLWQRGDRASIEYKVKSRFWHKLSTIFLYLLSLQILHE